MTAGYRLTPRARERLVRIVRSAEDRFGRRVALRVLAQLERAIESLAAHPGTGHLREDLTQDENIRSWSVGPTLIAYRFHRERLEVLFIERAERDWERLLGDGSSPDRSWSGD